MGLDRRAGLVLSRRWSARMARRGFVDKLLGGFRPYLLLSAFCLVLFLPGLAALPPLDRDESRFAQATRQMLETGDFVRIQFQDEMRAKKPAGAYWAQAASVSFFSTPESRAMWPYRLPSALAGWAAVLITFAFGRFIFGTLAAFLGAGLLGGSLMLVAEAHQAKADALLLACAAAAFGALARFHQASRPEARLPMPGWPVALVFWLAQGAAILIKGPVLAAVTLLAILVLAIVERRAGWLLALRPVTGMAVAAAIAAPWYAAISQATDGAFVGEAVKSDLLPKLLGAQESHGGKPGSYLLLASLTFWPGSLLLWPALAHAWGQRARAGVLFGLAWAIPGWVMFELVPTKLPHYVLPLFPALALLTGLAVAEGAKALTGRLARLWAWVWVLIGLILAGAVLLLPIVYGGGFAWGALAAALGIVLATLLPATLMHKGRPVHAALALALTAAATFPAVFEGLLPRLDRLALSRQVAEVADILAPGALVASAGYSEPSLVFLLGTKTLLTNGSGAAGHLAAHADGMAVVALGENPDFLAAAAGQGLLVSEQMRIDGFNYSRGKPATLILYTRIDGGAE